MMLAALSPVHSAAMVAAVVLLVATVRRPAVGCAVLTVASPLLGGLGRDVLVPLLRPSEAIAAVVLVGAVLHYLPQRRYRPPTNLELIVAAYAVGMVVVPAAVLTMTRSPFGVDLGRAVAAPLQYLAIFLLLSRVDLGEDDRRLILGLTLAAGTVVAVVGIAQLADVPGVRQFLSSFYVHSPDAEMCQFGVCRPTSLLEHWASYGAYAALQFTVALALLTTGEQVFSTRLLSVVLGLNGMAVVASQTQAAVAAALLGTGLVLWYGTRVPAQLWYAVAGLVLSLVIFWPQMYARYEQQVGAGSAQGALLPQSVDTRLRYWDAYFLPAVRENLWVGTGTVIPPEVPESLVKYVDNEYLRVAFRAGLVGLVLHLSMLMALARSALRQRHRAEPMTRAIGAVALTYAAILALMGVTGDYLTFQGIAQTFWILAGLLGSVVVEQSEREPRAADAYAC